MKRLDYWLDDRLQVAVWVQLQSIWQDELQPQEAGNLFCGDLKVAVQNLQGNIFYLFDNNAFREFDKKGYHPSYLVGASVVNTLIHRIQISGLQKLWNEIGRIQNSTLASKFLAQVINEKDLLNEMNDYFQRLASDIQRNTGVSCSID